jgi:cytidyltransferase-like protein
MRVFISGTFDLLHSGHVTFLQQAAMYGELFVGVGSDASILKYKGHNPIYSEEERLFMLRSLKCVTEAWINSGEGPLDFIEDLEHTVPDIHICNEDQDSEERKLICQDLGIEYIVLKRNTIKGLHVRSTTNLIQLCKSR